MRRNLDHDFGAILASARKGDEEAWEYLFRLVSGRVVGFLIARGTPDPEGVAGEVFADVVRSIRRFHGDSRDFLSWVLTIAHRRMVDAVRAATRRREVPGLEEHLDHPGPDDVEEAALGLVGAVEAQRLLSRLTNDQADVLALRIYGGMTLPEVAEHLRKPLTAVTSLQHRALEALRKILAES